MSLHRYTCEESIDVDLRVDVPEPSPDEHPDKHVWRVKEAVLQQMAELLAASGKCGSTKKLFQDLVFREKKATTGIGSGIAIPHIRTLQSKELRIAVGIARDGVEFAAVDGKPVSIFVAMVTPTYEDKLYLRVLKSLGQTFQSERVKTALLEAANAGEVLRALSRLT